VGTTAGFYEMTTRPAVAGSTTMSATIGAPLSAWTHMAVEFVPHVIRQFKIPGAGLSCRRLKPFMLAGAGWMDNLDLELPTTIGAFLVLSNPILVAGFNSFMLVMEVAVSVVICAVWHCDPQSYAPLGDALTIGSVNAGVADAMAFGAFSPAAGEDTAGMDWYVIRIAALANSPPDATLVYAQLFGGRR
jgi:hypothetical protein